MNNGSSICLSFSFLGLSFCSSLGKVASPKKTLKNILEVYNVVVNIDNSNIRYGTVCPEYPIASMIDSFEKKPDVRGNPINDKDAYIKARNVIGINFLRPPIFLISC